MIEIVLCFANQNSMMTAKILMRYDHGHVKKNYMKYYAIAMSVYVSRRLQNWFVIQSVETNTIYSIYLNIYAIKYTK